VKFCNFDPNGCPPAPCTYYTVGGSCTAENFPTDLVFNLTGLYGGPLAGVTSTISLAGVWTTVERENFNPNASQATVALELTNFSATTTAHPLFSSFTVKIGQGQGLPPSPGQAVVMPVDSAEFNLYSTYNVTYQIAWVGRSGGPLSGLSDTSTASAVMQLGQAGIPRVPTLTAWGMGVLVLFLLLAGGILMRRRYAGGRTTAG
jgi:hypothetical protein